MGNEKKLSAAEQEELLAILETRFAKNANRHKGIEWANVLAKLLADKGHKLWSLQQMETTGGEPDVVGVDAQTGEFIFYDCSAESPKGRRSYCYDREALESRKEFKPANNAGRCCNRNGNKYIIRSRIQDIATVGCV